MGRIVVGLKRALDAFVEVKVLSDGRGVDLSHPFSLNPWCAVALEEGLRLREAGRATEVVAVTVGPDTSVEVLRTALALGANRVLHVLQQHAEEALQPLAIATALAGVARREEAALLLVGRQSTDRGSAQTGPMAAAFLGWPQAVGVSHIALDEACAFATVRCETDEQWRLQLPAVVSAGLRLNTPRYASLPATLRAKRAAVPQIDLTELLPEAPAAAWPRIQTLSASAAPARPAATMVTSVVELLAELRRRGVVPEVGRGADSNADNGK